MTASDLALASLVALRPDRIGTTCPAWIESAGRPCGHPQTIGLLCARHHKAAESRWADAIEREKARLARSVASAREIETKRLLPRRPRPHPQSPGPRPGMDRQGRVR